MSSTLAVLPLPARPASVRDEAALVESLKLLPTVFSIGRSTRALMGLHLERLSLSAGQDQLLVLLDRTTPMSVGEAAHALNVRPSTVSKMVDRLVGAGYITRARPEHDSRQCVLRLTEPGMQKRSDVIALWTTIEGELLKALPARGAMKDIDAVAAALERRLSRLR